MATRDGGRLTKIDRRIPPAVRVAFCMVAGVTTGRLLHGLTSAIRGLTFGEGSQIKVAIAVLIWLMDYPIGVPESSRWPGSSARVSRRPH